jgi:parallel beta-helix repeat protein
MRRRTSYALLGTFALCIGGVLIAAPADAAHATAYVAPHGHSKWDSSCSHAGFSSIQKAIDSLHRGGTVIVCRGTYHEMVTVDRQVTVRGNRGATIDATGQPYGIGVMVPYVTIRGLTVKNASDTVNGPADGIITGGFGPNGPVAADHVTIVDNTVTGNLGSGIDLNSTSYSVASDNIAERNGVGVNVADDLGPHASHNVISHNRTNENFGGCGIALADHTGAGVIDNLVVGNVANDNGLSTPTAPDASAGSGVILASPVPGGVVTGNTIALNSFSGNGHGGVVVHSHAPGSDFSRNVIAGNRIGLNNLRTDTSDPHSTGIYLGSASPMQINVTGNIIGPDYYGIFTAGAVTVTGGRNIYHNVKRSHGHVATY